MAKRNSTCFLLFDDKILVNFGTNELKISYKIDDIYSFLHFYPKTKEFKEVHGFGSTERSCNPKWLKEYRWKEMNERV